jgi:2-desacetyl-2-hydroxyethyl bacteriochlorophyllide A dehydrogenase
MTTATATVPVNAPTTKVIATAIVFPAVNEVELVRHEVCDLQPDEILVATEYSGISQGTEIWALQGRRPELTYPTVPGYQAVGKIVRLGSEVSDLAIGERVLFTSSRLPDSYPKTWMAAHVSHAVVQARLDETVYRLDPAINPIAASIAALPAVSLRGIGMVNITPGDCVVVTGLGLIGQSSVQLANAAGAIVIAVDLDANRRAKALACGAALALDPKTENIGAMVRSIRSAGADLVIETTGRSQALGECIDLLRWEGQILLQGWYPDPVTFDFHHAHGKKPTIAITCGIGSIPETLHLMKHEKLAIRELITHVVPVTQAPEIYNRLAARDPDILGVVFDWSELA